jgi:hypothetical protein
VRIYDIDGEVWENEVESFEAGVAAIVEMLKHCDGSPSHEDLVIEEPRITLPGQEGPQHEPGTRTIWWEVK